MPFRTVVVAALRRFGRRLQSDVRDDDPWLALFVTTRLVAAAVALSLLALLHVSGADLELAVATMAWTSVSVLAYARFPGLDRRWVAWLVDGAVALAFIWLSTDWRSPFYIFALTTLILPATGLRFRSAVAWGMGFTGAYFATVVLLERVGGQTVRQGVRLEIAATHLVVPLVVVLALAHANVLLARLRRQQQRSAQLAVEAERRRIAWELHDSAKQRVHAAHLVLTAIGDGLSRRHRDIVDRALNDLTAATGEMDTTVRELRSPVAERPIDQLLQERAEDLDQPWGPAIEVRGRLPPLSETVAAHVYRIAAEAMSNAVRHGDARTIDVRLGSRPLRVVITDDGVGLPASIRPGAHGLRSMRQRARAIGASLSWVSAPGQGTSVVLELADPSANQEPHDPYADRR